MPSPTSVRFFDHASTTRCSPEAARLIQSFSVEQYGNPSSSHALGQEGARAIREARLHFARWFRVEPEQVIFTGSGTESDNLAVQGTFLAALTDAGRTRPLRVLTSATEHPAVKKSAQSLSRFGAEVQSIPIGSNGQIPVDAFEPLITPSTVLISVHQVNNITGAILPVEDLAALAKRRSPSVLFHTDAVQAFTKVPHPRGDSSVDLVSISAHKIHGPKGVGALIVLNPKLLRQGLDPLILGGDQEGGFRSGTPNPGLIAAFRAAAARSLEQAETDRTHRSALRAQLMSDLRGFFAEKDLTFNSPEDGVSHILNLSLPGTPAGPLARLIEERGFLISTGSACHSHKEEPDPILAAMGLAQPRLTSALRISFDAENTAEETRELAMAIRDSVEHLRRLRGRR